MPVGMAEASVRTLRAGSAGVLALRVVEVRVYLCRAKILD